MRVLVACEFSGVVRDAFVRLGHDAMSCDVLPSEVSGKHYQGDVRDILGNGWDLMIAHPPCTYLTNAGVRWLSTQDGRWDKMREAALFFKLLLDAPIPKVVIENPIMHGYASRLVGRKQDQVIQPYMFGHMESKATCLWLRGVPKLQQTENVYADMLKLPKSVRDRVHYMSPGKDRWRERSRTLPNIAAAMAEQWSGLERSDE